MAMIFSQVVTAIKECRKAGISAIWEGGPGMGKTAAGLTAAYDLFGPKPKGGDGAELADRLGIYSTSLSRLAPGKEAKFYRELRPAQMDPTQLRGVLHINKDNVAVWSQTNMLPTKGKGLIIIEELADCPKLMQSALYELMFQHKIGEQRLGAGWSVVAFTNSKKHGCAAGSLSKALGSRALWGQMVPSMNEYLDFGHSVDLHPLIRGYLKRRPDNFYNFDPRIEGNFGSPRTWLTFSNLINSGLSDSIWHEAAIGCVGEGAGNEINGFRQIFNKMPGAQEILADPTGVEIPEDVSLLYATSGCLANVATASNAADIITYLKRLPGEFQQLIIRDCVAGGKGFEDAREVGEWILENRVFHEGV